MRYSTILPMALVLLTAGVTRLSSAAQPPRPHSRDEVEAVLAKAPPAPSESQLRNLNIVLLAGRKDHGPNEHDYPLWQKRWKVLLGGKGPSDEPQVTLYGPALADDSDKMLAGAVKVNVTTAWVWPSKEQLAAADLIVMHAAPNWTAEHLKDLETFLARGGGFVVVHMAIWQVSKELADVIGLAKQEKTRFRHGPVTLKLTAPEHPLCLGLPEQISLIDESYFDFQGDASKVKVLATSDELRTADGNPTAEPMFWTIEHSKGRVYVCIPGHYDWTFDDPFLRVLLLRGMAWAAKGSPYRFDPLVLRGAALAGAAVKPRTTKTAPVAVEATPPDPNDPNLLLWLDASDAASLTIDADGRVSAWANKAAQVGHKLTSTDQQRPLYVASGQGGRPAIQFDGADDVLRDVAFQRSAQTWTVILVVTPRSNRANGRFHALFASNRPGGLDYRTGLNLDLGAGATADFSALNLEGIKDKAGAGNLRTSSAPFGQGQLVVVSTGALLSQLFVNGEAEGTRPANGATTSLAEIRVGARYYQAKEQGYFDGDIAEVLFYGVELSDQQRSAICAYLAGKYGLSLTEPVAYTLDDAFAALPKYDGMSSRRVLGPLERAIADAHGDPAACKALESRLAAVLRSDASRAAKDYVCRRLSTLGSADSVPALSLLLSDPGLSHMARYALERIPDSAAVTALRAALPKLSGKIRLGVINSLAVRRDAEAVPALTSLLNDADAETAGTAVAALGKIGTSEAAVALTGFKAKASATLQPAVAEACLSAAEQLLRQGQTEAVAKIYQTTESDQAEQIRSAALRGLVAAQPAQAATRLLKALAGDNSHMRGLAAQFIRETPGAAATAVFAGELAKLPPPGQAALLDALSDRDDPAVRAAALRALRSKDDSVRRAALHALVVAGRSEDVLVLADLAAQAGATADRDPAFDTLNRLRAEGTDAAMMAQLAKARPAARVVLIRSLVVRGFSAAVPRLIEAAGDRDAAVRREALKALQTLAGEKHADALVGLLLKSAPGEQRAAAERAVVAACRKAADPGRRAAPLLKALAGADVPTRCILLSALGALGGEESLALVHAAMKDRNAEIRDAGIAALANWPDATVVPELLDLAKTTTNDFYRVRALRGVARVAPRPGQLPPQEAFQVLKQAFELAQQPDEKRLILSRMAPVRVPDCLAFALSHLNDPTLQAEATAAAASLAEGMKESHPQQARAAMEKLLQATDDASLRNRLEKLLGDMKKKGN